MSEYRDSSGRIIEHGDLLRIPHYRDARCGRQVYLYKLVVQEVDLGLVAVAIPGIASDGLGSHRCPVQFIGECEIIDSLTGPGPEFLTWWDRPKVQEAKP